MKISEVYHKKLWRVCSPGPFEARQYKRIIYQNNNLTAGMRLRNVGLIVLPYETVRCFGQEVIEYLVSIFDIHKVIDL